ncbi:MAG: 50S ribosomal protein L32 [Phycisphaerales bacterium]|nr:50S ribosomal protein L32 [Phycisphaerales bacterium]
MAVPALRTSPSRKRKRRSHLAITPRQSGNCPSCGAAKLPHRTCRACGYVRPGLQVTTSGDE